MMLQIFILRGEVIEVLEETDDRDNPEPKRREPGKDYEVEYIET